METYKIMLIIVHVWLGLLLCFNFGNEEKKIYEFMALGEKRIFFQIKKLE